MTEKVGVILMNLGGPDSPEAVEPFLFNLFNDPAIIRLPGLLRWLIARLISKRRAPIAQEIYKHIGGRSPIVPETEAQRAALEAELAKIGIDAACGISMRYWHPLAEETALEFKAAGISTVVLLPLYPQFSTTTTESSVKNWLQAARKIGYSPKCLVVGCYPTDPAFINGYSAQIVKSIQDHNISISDRIRFLFSAHGLPEKIIASGDPYAQQVEASVAAVKQTLKDKFGVDYLDIVTCYQSRVGPMKWIGPSTEDEIKRAGQDQKDIVLVPISFVSEHSETLVELDIEYQQLAVDHGVSRYIRVPAIRTNPDFIKGLAQQVKNTLERTISKDPWECPPEMSCACRESDLRNGPRTII